MQYRILGKTGLKVSLVSLGSGGPSQLGQKTGLTENDQDRLVRRALDLGVNFIDTSEVYGDSESILGRALSGIPRDSYYLASKCFYKTADGRIRDPEDLASSIDRSIQKLKIDCIDVMQFHVLNSQDYFEVIDRIYPVMDAARRDGKIRFIGFSEQFKVEPDHRVVTMALKNHPQLWDTVMLKYGILNQYAANEALPLCSLHNVGVINMAVIREKLPDPVLLSEQIRLWKSQGLIAVDDISDEGSLDWVIRGDVRSIIEAGYRFAADHPAVSTVLTGTSSISHLEDNISALERPFLPESDKARLRKLFGRIAVYI